MSSLAFEVHALPENAESKKQLKRLIDIARKSDTKAMIDLIPQHWGGDAAYLAENVDFEVPTEENKQKLLVFSFESGTLFDIDSFGELLQIFGVSKFEIEVYSTQVGENWFMDEAGEYSSYGDKKWRWLPRPESAFEDDAIEGEFIVVTGVFAGFSRAEIEEMIEEAGGTVQKTVNSKTTILFAGDRTGQTKVKKAKELGVRVLGVKDVERLIV